MQRLRTESSYIIRLLKTIRPYETPPSPGQNKSMHVKGIIKGGQPWVFSDIYLQKQAKQCILCIAWFLYIFIHLLFWLNPLWNLLFLLCVGFKALWTLYSTFCYAWPGEFAGPGRPTSIHKHDYESDLPLQAQIKNINCNSTLLFPFVNLKKDKKNEQDYSYQGVTFCTILKHFFMIKLVVMNSYEFLIHIYL